MFFFPSKLLLRIWEILFVWGMWFPCPRKQAKKQASRELPVMTCFGWKQTLKKGGL